MTHEIPHREGSAKITILSDKKIHLMKSTKITIIRESPMLRKIASIENSSKIIDKKIISTTENTK